MNSDLISHSVQNALFHTWRRESIGDKSYLVVKGVPLVEGVLNSRFVSAKEFGSFPKDWDGVPIVLRHPKQNGGSARVPTSDAPTIGRFYNSKMDGTRLVGEFWFDEDILKNIDGGDNIITMVENQHPIEVSTGYYAESIPQSGKWNEKEYSLIDQNLHPDHIAILPDEIGACSLADGCGLNRNHAMKTNAMAGSLDKRINDVYDAFYTLVGRSDSTPVAATQSDIYPEGVFDNFVVCKKDGKLYQVDYSYNPDGIEFAPESEWREVIKIEEYIPVQNVTGLTGEAAKMWEDIYQKAKVTYKDRKDTDAIAAQTAWAAVKKKYEKNKDGKWVLKQNGGPGSGFFAPEHQGIPGKQGGSKSGSSESSAVREVSKGISGYSKLSKKERDQKIKDLSSKGSKFLGTSLDTLRESRSEYVSELSKKYGQDNVMKGNYPDSENAVLDDMDAYEKILIEARSKKVKSNTQTLDISPTEFEGLASLVAFVSG